MKTLTQVHEANSKKIIPLTVVYNALYAQGQKVLDEHNPCNFHYVKVTGGETMRCTRGYPCCGTCEYLSVNGCTVKALGCKLALCDKAAAKFPEAKQKLDTLARTAESLGIPLHYGEGMGYYCW